MSSDSNVVMTGLVPGIPIRRALPSLSGMPGIADKFTQSAQARLLLPGMTMAMVMHAAHNRRTGIIEMTGV
jgi:hypothetical protein